MKELIEGVIHCSVKGLLGKTARLTRSVAFWHGGRKIAMEPSKQRHWALFQRKVEEVIMAIGQCQNSAATRVYHCIGSTLTCMLHHVPRVDSFPPFYYRSCQHTHGMYGMKTLTLSSHFSNLRWQTSPVDSQSRGLMVGTQLLGPLKKRKWPSDIQDFLLLFLFSMHPCSLGRQSRVHDSTMFSSDFPTVSPWIDRANPDSVHMVVLNKGRSTVRSRKYDN